MDDERQEKQAPDLDTITRALRKRTQLEIKYFRGNKRQLAKRLRANGLILDPDTGEVRRIDPGNDR